MKTLILADMHTKDPCELIERKSQEGIERVISLGDIDKPEILERFLSLKIEKKALVGNHEYLFIHSFINGDIHPSIDSFTWKKEKIDEIYNKWHSSKILEDYARDCLRKLNKEGERGFQFSENINGQNILYLHGLLYAPITNKYHTSRVWGSLKDGHAQISYDLLKENFVRMQENNYDLMFRGHDHKRCVESIDSNKDPMTTCIWDENNPTQKKQKIYLREKRNYIITVGGFCLGSYLVFDSGARTLSWDNVA